MRRLACAVVAAGLLAGCAHDAADTPPPVTVGMFHPEITTPMPSVLCLDLGLAATLAREANQNFYPESNAPYAGGDWVVVQQSPIAGAEIRSNPRFRVVERGEPGDWCR